MTSVHQKSHMYLKVGFYLS